MRVRFLGVLVFRWRQLRRRNVGAWAGRLPHRLLRSPEISKGRQHWDTWSNDISSSLAINSRSSFFRWPSTISPSTFPVKTLPSSEASIYNQHPPEIRIQYWQMHSVIPTPLEHISPMVRTLHWPQQAYIPIFLTLNTIISLPLGTPISHELLHTHSSACRQEEQLSSVTTPWNQYVPASQALWFPVVKNPSS